MSEKQATLLLRIKESGSEALSKVSDLIGDIGKAAMAAGVAIAGFVGLAVSQFREQELATNQLNQAMVQQGIYTSDLSKSYIEMASSLQKVTTFGDEQIISAQAILQAHIGQRKVTEDLVRATLDLAAKTGDLDGAAQMVGKSIGSSTNALARQGIEIDANATVTEKYSQVIEGLNNKFGGQAAAAAKGLGSLDQMKNAISDLMETVGEKFGPYISFFARQMTVFTQTLGTSQNAISGLEASVVFISKSFAVLKNIVTSVGAVIGTGLAASIESVTLLTQGEFTRAKETAALGMTEVGEIIKGHKNTLNAELAEIDMIKEQEAALKREEEILLLTEAEGRKTGVKMAELAKQTEAEKKQAEDAKKIADKKVADQATADKKREQDQAATLQVISSLQNSHNSALATIGKAAAITQIAIDTPVAIGRALAAFPPPFNFAAAGLVGVAMAAQAARIAGVQLAEGGIVKATPGGVPAIIGEGGRDEAVIPLENGQIPGSGGGITININGAFVGDEQSAYALAKVVDEQLLRMRQNNESLSMEGLT